LASSTEKNGRVCQPARCSLAAGLLAGILSHFAAPVLVHAQTQTTPTKELSAQRFVLVDPAGVPGGEFGIDKDGNASMQLLDKDGRVVWSAGKTKAKPLSASETQRTTRLPKIEAGFSAICTPHDNTNGYQYLPYYSLIYIRTAGGRSKIRRVGRCAEGMRMGYGPIALSCSDALLKWAD
jgi:hypothetical protein